VIIREEDEIMSRLRILTMLGVVLLAVAASVPALAHGGHGHGPRVSFGFAFAGPAFYYPAYYYPPYYYPRAIAVPAAPTVYIERGDAYTPTEQSQGYWYYCPESKAYHPYVKHCPGGWQKHTPTPPPDG